MPSVEVFGRRIVDARPDRLDLRDRIYRPPLRPIEPEFPTPEQIKTFLESYEHLILDQGSSGRCTGYGLAAVINYQYWFRAQKGAAALRLPKSQQAGGTGQKPAAEPGMPEHDRVSPRMLYQLAKLYDEWDGEDYEGSSCRGAMRGWHHHGVCLDEYWPENTDGMNLSSDAWIADAARHPLGAYYRVETRSIADMQAAIQEIHAVYVSATIHDGWNLDTSRDRLVEIDWSPEVRPLGAHAFAIVGYNSRGFIVQNSWGRKWGTRGFALLTYPDWLANAMDAWVAVYGAPIVIERTPVAVTSSGLLAHASRERAHTPAAVAGSASSRPTVRRWDESTSYLHSIVLGNEGRPITRLVRADTGADHVRIAAEDSILAWCRKKRGNRKVLIYAHGGLNDEAASLRRIRVLGPAFAANGIYPLFVTWKTGILETLGNVFRDAFSKEQADVPLDRSRGLGTVFREIGDRIAGANDYTWEAIARRVAVKSLWTEMKENAASASNAGGGTFMLARHMDALRTKYPEIEFHLVGHSAGSLVFGHLFDELRRLDVAVNTMTLFAPACTLAFATRYFGAAFEKPVLERKDVFLHVLTDENERDDTVAGIYRKSLLYLVSRALEKDHKTPLLGMMPALDPMSASYRPNTFAKDHDHPDIKAWHRTWRRKTDGVFQVESREVATATMDAPDGKTYMRSTHGSFDNNIAVMTETLERILGRRLPVAIDDLSEF